MVFDWMDKQIGNAKEKFTQTKRTVDKTIRQGKESVRDIDRVVSASRGETGASRHTRAENLSDKQLIEKRFSAEEKIRLKGGKTLGSLGVAVGATKLLQLDHALLKGTGTIMNAAGTANQLVHEAVYVDEFNRRGLSEATCGRQRRAGLTRRGIVEGGLGEVKSVARGELFSDLSGSADQYMAVRDNTPSVPAFITPPSNVPVYSSSYTTFPAGIPTTPVYMNSYV